MNGRPICRGNVPRGILFAFTIALSLLAGCATENTNDQAMNISFAPELGVDLDQMEQTASGLRYLDKQIGEGTEATGGPVVVHYTGWLPDGTQFDSSRSRGPFSFLLGGGEVISGWDEGVKGMKVGGVRQLVIPSDLAYGPRGAGGVIPPNAVLVFEVELLDVR